jgi:hypothetical protein
VEEAWFEANRKMWDERVPIHVAGNVYDAPRLLGRRFEIVYTGLGALCWLPDIERWADAVADLTAPNGTFCITEFHPISDMLSDDDFAIVRPYFHDEPQVWDEPGTYADLSATTTHDRSYE